LLWNRSAVERPPPVRGARPSFDFIEGRVSMPALAIALACELTRVSP
jgi:hypothetical protein